MNMHAWPTTIGGVPAQNGRARPGPYGVHLMSDLVDWLLLSTRPQKAEIFGAGKESNVPLPRINEAPFAHRFLLFEVSAPITHQVYACITFCGFSTEIGKAAICESAIIEFG